MLVSIEFMLIFKRFFSSKVNLKIFFKILIRGSRICLQGKECTLLLFFSFCLEGQLSKKTIQQFCRADLLSGSLWEGTCRKPFPVTPLANPSPTKTPGPLAISGQKLRSLPP